MQKRLLASAIIIIIILSSAQAFPLLDVRGPAAAPFTLGLAGGALDVNGNTRVFERYVTPSEGVYGDINAQAVAADGANVLDLSAWQIGEPTAQRGNLWLVANHDALVVQAQARESRYFRDFTDTAAPFRRSDSAARAKMRAGAGEFRVGYASVTLTESGETPAENWNRAVPSVDYRVGLPNGGVLGAGFAQESFAFRTGPQFSGQTQTLRFAFSPPSSRNTSLQADAALSQTFFDTLGGENNGSQLSLRGVQMLHPDLALTGELSQDVIHDTVIENAYARRDQGAELALEFSGLPRTTVEVGGRRHRVDYVNGTQTLVVPVDEDTLFARATTRLTRQLRLRLIGNTTHLQHDPLSENLFDEPYGSLIWSRRNDLRTELTFTPTWRTGLTGRLRRLAWENDSFSTQSSLTESSIAGWWMPRDQITLYVTYLAQNIRLTGVDANPERYLTDNQTFVYGGSYRVNPRLLIDLALTDTDSTGAQDTEERSIALGTSYAFKSGVKVNLRASTGDYNSDLDALLNNDHRWLELSVSDVHF